MADEPCDKRCPVDEREKGRLWERIDSLRERQIEVDKSMITHNAEIRNMTLRLETIQKEWVDKLDTISSQLTKLTQRVVDDSDTLRRYEGAQQANRKWAWIILTVIGILAAGGYTLVNVGGGS